MERLRTSVLIPSLGRPDDLRRCLRSLAEQTTPPDEILVVWQEQDQATREAAELERPAFGEHLIVLHALVAGIVPSENLALGRATGDVIFLLDDDAVAPPDWIARHLAHYADSRVGAVGGPADNHHPDGSLFPRRDRQPQGRLSWLGRIQGNMYDQPLEWRRRPPIVVDHLVGYNLSLRRSAFDRFEERLRPYWQLFELDACWQARRRGWLVLFDFAIVVQHHPRNTAYVEGRGGDLTVKVDNAAYNQAFVLAKHARGVRRWAMFAYLLGVGTTALPGPCGWFLAIARHGQPRRELAILARSCRAKWSGWRQGTLARVGGGA